MTALGFMIGCPPAQPNGGTAREFSMQLTGANEVPPVTTSATGRSEVNIAADDQSITFRVEAENIVNVAVAHIHVGAAGTNGPIIFFLFNSATQGQFASPVTGILYPQDFIPAGGLTTFEEAIAAIRAGNTYVNVHTTANPNGEIRGQLAESTN
jgi:hypothetical protein